MKTKQVRITEEAFEALKELAKVKTDNVGVPVNLTYAASIAIENDLKKEKGGKNGSNVEDD